MSRPTQIQRRTYRAKYHANEKAAQLGIEGRLTNAEVRSILDRNVCHYCGKVYEERFNEGSGPTTDTFGIDHVIPLKLGGPNTVDNLVLACHGCNVRKFLAPEPGHWSPKHFHKGITCCVECGTTERRHEANGLCIQCHSRLYDRAHPERTTRKRKVTQQ